MGSEHDGLLPETAEAGTGYDSDTDTDDDLVVPPPPPPAGPEGTLGGRLHPAAIAVNGVGQLLPLVFLLFAGPFALPMVLGIGSIGFVAAGIQWYRFTWRIDAEGLVIEQGLLQRKRRVMPLGRIQSVESVRKLRHRVFGVTALRVESVGGDDTEGRLEALDPQLAEHVRRVLLRRAPAAPTPTDGVDAHEDEGEQLVRLSFGQLVAAGLTGGRVGIAAAILGFGQELWLDPLLRNFDDQVLDSATRNVTLVVSVIAVAAVALFVISVFATALVFWDFTLTHRGDTLGVRRGLLEQRSDTIPLRRIQAVRIEENVLRRLLGLAAVRVEIAGRGGGGDVGGQTDVVLPIGPRHAALTLADRLMGTEEPVAGRPLTPMPTAARTRRIVRALVTGGLSFLPALIDVRLAWIGVVVTAVGLAIAVASYRALGWAATDDHMLAQSGVLVRRRWVVPAPAVQSAQVTVTPFQRRRRLASLSLEIARSGNAGDPTLHDLDDGDAARLLDAAAAHSTEAGRAQVAARRRRLGAGRAVEA